MRFTLIAASLIAAVAAQSSGAADETCSVMTVTVTETAGHTPVAPSSMAPYYPTETPAGGAGLVPEASTAVSAAPPMGTGTAAPSGTGAAGSPYPEFTGAAAGMRAGGLMAGVAGVAVMLL